MRGTAATLFLALSTSIWGISLNAKADVTGKIYVDREETATMTAGKETDWIFEFLDSSTGVTLDHFMIMHEKPMHLLAISQDLSRFAHIHPAPLGNHSGLFGIMANQRSTDPDNRDAEHVVSQGGDYFLYAEIMPMDSFAMMTDRIRE